MSQALIDYSGLRQRIENYQNSYLASSFRHCLIDRLCDPEALALASREIPGPEDEAWHRYDSPLEKKRSLRCHEPGFAPGFAPGFQALLYELNSDAFVALMGEISGIEGLIADSSLLCTELHCSEPQSFLGIHTDATVHPRDFQLLKRLTAVLYLSPDWRECQGGDLELWNPDVSERLAAIAPRFNRLVLFESAECSYHGHPHPLQAPPGFLRYSLTASYFTRAASPHEHPRKALFHPRPHERGDGLDGLRRDRSNIAPIPYI
ncbi:MAG: 2OG-Fe(II) oxygenase [Candidatus Sericytochromatia bacterium]